MLSIAAGTRIYYAVGATGKHGRWQSPMIRPSATKLEVADKQHAVSCGGMAAILELIKTLGLRKELNAAAKMFKLCLPYDEAGHIFNIALNLVAGGTRLDHIGRRRNDEAYLTCVGVHLFHRENATAHGNS